MRRDASHDGLKRLHSSCSARLGDTARFPFDQSDPLLRPPASGLPAFTVTLNTERFQPLDLPALFWPVSVHPVKGEGSGSRLFSSCSPHSHCHPQPSELTGERGRVCEDKPGCIGYLDHSGTSRLVVGLFALKLASHCLYKSSSLLGVWEFLQPTAAPLLPFLECSSVAFFSGRDHKCCSDAMSRKTDATVTKTTP
ncbi:hypothetical protein SRHO_G00276210 [Serrasalmus rhombeus]